MIEFLKNHLGQYANFYHSTFSIINLFIKSLRAKKTKIFLDE